MKKFDQYDINRLNEALRLLKEVSDYYYESYSMSKLGTVIYKLENIINEQTSNNKYY